MKHLYRRKFIVALAAGTWLTASSMFAATWYIDPNGSDNNAGSSGAPFATIMKAQSVASAGDVVIINDGTYAVAPVYASQQKSVYEVVNYITKGGITYQAAAGTRPVFDFSAVNPTGYRVAAFWVAATNVTFQGFDVIGIKENITNVNNQSLGFAVYKGWSNTWNQVNVHDSDCTGFYIGGDVSGQNLFYRCDSYNNTGIDSYSYGNADGFGCHTGVGGVRNVFRECRAWNNSDDGYDCLNCAESVTYDHCWSYLNGNNGGNGNGFKVGGWGCSGGTMPAVIPVHTVEFCLSAMNNSHNFYANHQPGQSANWYNNTAYGTSHVDFDTLEGVDDGSQCSIAGYREVMHNNLAYGATLTADYNETGSIVATNTWTLNLTLSDADFLSVEPSQMTQPRNADGSLPGITFMHPASGSAIIDAGMNLGFAFNGAAPDLGCFESGTFATNPPPAPIGLTATTISYHQIDLSWTASTGATSYNVKRATTSGGPFTTIATSVAATSFSDDGLSGSTAYYYVVSALNNAGESADSSQASATTFASPPVSPTALVANGGNLTVGLSWTQSTSPGISGNNVYRSTTGSGGPFNLLANLAASTVYTDTQVAAGNTYYYSITAVNSGGESALSGYAGAITVPPTPSGLAATAGDSQVGLSWSASTGANGYNVKRATTSGGPYTTIASGVSAASYTDTTAANGTTYYYVVSAVNGSGESANSSQVSAMPSAPVVPVAPTNLTGYSPHRKQITLNWAQSTSPNIAFNNVYRATVSGGPYTVVATIAANTTYTDTGLSRGTTYYYVVTASDGNGLESPYSNQISVQAN